MTENPEYVESPVAPAPVQGNTTSYVVDEHAIALTTTFSVEKNGADSGEVVKKMLSLTPTYTYSDNGGNCLAIGSRALMSWGNKVNITDCSGNDLASIHENVSASANTAFTASYSPQ